MPSPARSARVRTRAEVGAGLRLGQVHRRHPLARDEARQIALLSAGRGVRLDRVDGARGQHRPDRKSRGAGVPEFLHRHADHHRQALAAERLGGGDAAPAGVAEPPIGLAPAGCGEHAAVLAARADAVADRLIGASSSAAKRPASARMACDRFGRRSPKTPLASAASRPAILSSVKAISASGGWKAIHPPTRRCLTGRRRRPTTRPPVRMAWGAGLVFDFRHARSARCGRPESDAAAAALARGALVGMPTETVYGLAADATNPDAVAGIFAAKGRPRFNPLIVHVASRRCEARRFATFSPGADASRRSVLAGSADPRRPPRTRCAPIADLVTAGLDTIALRAPAIRSRRSCLAAFGRPLAAPSANRSGHVSATTAAHVAADLGDQVACILDAGPTRARPRIDHPRRRAATCPCSCAPAAVGRERDRSGARPAARASPARCRSQPRAPGMLASHYAPKAPLRLDARRCPAGGGVAGVRRHVPEGASAPPPSAISARAATLARPRRTSSPRFASSTARPRRSR